MARYARYMVTSACNMHCDYCISKNVNLKQDNNPVRIANLMQYVSKLHGNLELTGGEPLIDPWFDMKLLLAEHYFDSVSARTAQPQLLNDWRLEHLDSVNVSGHDLELYLDRPASMFINHANLKIYLSINNEQYFQGIAKQLKHNGWDGLSIWEDVFEGKPKSNLNLPEIPGFSIRHLGADECLDQLIVLPDLDIVTGREYELRFVHEVSKVSNDIAMFSNVDARL